MSNLSNLVSESVSAHDTYERLAHDEVFERGSPEAATEESISRLESHYGKPLPDDYKAFLRLRNGFLLFDGDSHILSIDHHFEDWLSEMMSERFEMFEEFGDENPISSGAIPIVLGEDSNAMVLYQKTEDGMRYVEYDEVELIESHSSLEAYIAEDLRIRRLMIEEEMNAGE